MLASICVDIDAALSVYNDRGIILGLELGETIAAHISGIKAWLGSLGIRQLEMQRSKADTFV